MSDSNTFSGMNVLLTGGTRGIGLATARRFAAAGARVVLNYRRDEETANAAVDSITADGGSARALRADIADPKALETMFESIGDAEGRLDIVVANAAATAFKPLIETKRHHIEKTFGITVGGFLELVKAAVSLMPGGGSIVAVSGFDAIRVLENHGSLGAAKAAMETLVRYLAVELAPRSVRVNGVSPGFVDTDSARYYGGQEFDTVVRPRWEAATPMKRLGSADEIAAVIAFLASNDASFVTGQTLVVDGGVTLTGVN